MKKNLITEISNMRRIMGLPTINEATLSESDIIKKLLYYARQGKFNKFDEIVKLYNVDFNSNKFQRSKDRWSDDTLLTFMRESYARSAILYIRMGTLHIKKSITLVDLAIKYNMPYNLELFNAKDKIDAYTKIFNTLENMNSSWFLAFKKRLSDNGGVTVEYLIELLDNFKFNEFDNELNRLLKINDAYDFDSLPYQFIDAKFKLRDKYAKQAMIYDYKDILQDIKNGETLKDSIRRNDIHINNILFSDMKKSSIIALFLSFDYKNNTSYLDLFNSEVNVVTDKMYNEFLAWIEAGKEPFKFFGGETIFYERFWNRLSDEQKNVINSIFKERSTTPENLADYDRGNKESDSIYNVGIGDEPVPTYRGLSNKEKINIYNQEYNKHANRPWHDR